MQTTLVISNSNSNWTEWSTIQGVIVRVILKSRKLRVRFLPEMYDTRFTYQLIVTGTKFEDKKSLNTFMCEKVKIRFNMFCKQ